MLSKIYSDHFSEYFRIEDHAAIELRWLPSTQSMTEQTFRTGLERLAELLERERLPNVLIDVVNFHHNPSPDFAEWRESAVIPRYNAAGVKKFAFLLPGTNAPTVENGSEPVAEGSAAFPTGYFSQRKTVLAWFDS